MKNCLKLFILILIFITQPCFAKDLKVLVLPDTLIKKELNTFVYSEASELISNDIINYLKNAPNLTAPSVSYVKQVVWKDYKTTKLTQATMYNFKNNYNINYTALRQISAKFNADLVLLITSNFDVQNYFMRRTWWDFLNIPGATIVDPAYRLSTQVYLVNPKSERILWQETYQKLISSRESRIIANNFNPETEQMEKVQRYSRMFLAPQITQEIQLVAYKVDEYSDFNKHPEIVKTNPLYFDSAKVNSQRGAVITGRWSKAEGRLIKKNTKAYIAKQKAEAQVRKEKRAVLKKEKALKKQQEKQAKEALKKQQAEAQTNEQPKEADVVIIKQEVKDLDLEFTPTKPRLRENNYTVNDL